MEFTKINNYSLYYWDIDFKEEIIGVCLEFVYMVARKYCFRMVFNDFITL